jgi:hypothetical protein
LEVQVVLMGLMDEPKKCGDLVESARRISFHVVQCEDHVSLKQHQRLGLELNQPQDS